MEYLIIILAAEGPTDYRFLKPLLERYLSQLNLRRPIELQIEEVSKNTGDNFSDYLAKIDTKAKEYAANFIVLHQDADANKWKDKNQQIKDSWAEQSSTYSLVAAIPVKMIEAWLLADPILLLEKGVGRTSPRKTKRSKTVFNRLRTQPFSRIYCRSQSLFERFNRKIIRPPRSQ